MRFGGGGGEYMLMASQLMLIKSCRLLPKVVEEVLEEEDPEQALLDQLEEYRKFKILSESYPGSGTMKLTIFQNPNWAGLRRCSSVQDKSTIDPSWPFPRSWQKTGWIPPSHTTIARDEYRIEDMMEAVRRQFMKQIAWPWAVSSRKVETWMNWLPFLATLELVKVHEISMEQKETFETFLFGKREDESLSWVGSPLICSWRRWIDRQVN